MYEVEMEADALVILHYSSGCEKWKIPGTRYNYRQGIKIRSKKMHILVIKDYIFLLQIYKTQWFLNILSVD